jgi:hypothetical protein
MSEQNVKPLPFFFVGKDVTNERINKFLTTKYDLLSDAIGKPDTRSIWYSKEHVEGWLSEINLANADGLRIYFGSYEETHPSYPKQTCLLMVLTREDSQPGVHGDISIEDEPDFALRSQTERSIVDFTERDYNVGSPCPPICGGTK